MLWALLFLLPVVKMVLLAVFLVFLWRSNADPAEAVEVRRAFGPWRPPKGPRPRGERGGPRGGVSTRRSRAVLGTGTGS
jgi:hypothetical protein